MRTLIVAEHRLGALRDVTRELVGAAAEVGGPVEVAVVARDPAALTEAVSLRGVDEVVAVPVPCDEFEPDVYQAALEALIDARSPEVILLGFTVNSMGFAPAVTAKLQLGFASDVHGLAVDGGSLVAVRSFYGSKVHAELEFPPGRPAILLLRPAAWPAAEPAGQPRVTELAVSPPPSRARHREFREVAQTGDVDITAADFLLAVGRGIGDRENLPMFNELAAKMGATLAASRPLVDAGWIPSSRQVGQSGKMVTPKVYLAFGISGAVQHVAGMNASGTIVAVNTDPEAAIFNVAHYGAVADLFDVAEELERLY